ncbi:MAG: T7SS effector LXG polymorphic toxin [Coriobacteriia bacterium]|nr:T7SS effector LXG polymorphic toxin [Coriobacteriia bacterium]
MAIPDEGGGSPYLIDYDQMTDLGFCLQGLTSGWGGQLQDIGEAVKAILGLGDFRGAAADSTKGYLSEVHAVVLLSLGEIISEVNTRFLLYKDGYLASVDSSLHARLDEEVIQDTFQAFDSSRNGFDARHASIQRIAESISDIMGAQAPSPYGVSDAYDTVLDNQKRLHEGIVAYESEHVLADFANLDSMIGALLGFIDENLLRGASGVAGYVPGSIAASNSFQTLCRSLQNAYDDRAGLAEEVSLAANREQQRLELLEAEWAQQREEEGWLNLLLGGLVVVGGIICIVATAGLATPLVVAGAVAGGATILYGSMNMVEAGQDIYYGSVGDYSTAAFNPLRDTVFEWAFGADGKQQAWDAFGTAAIVTSSVLSLGAGAYASASAAANAGTSVGRAVAVYGAKTAITIGAGAGAGYAGHEIALYYGASETVADIVGVVSGAATATAVGFGVQEFDQARNVSGFYQPANIPSSEVVLPEFDGKTTYGELRTPDGKSIPLQSGDPDPQYSNYVSSSHVEGKAAQYMRENGIEQATVYHNNANGTCGYCDKMLPTLLPDGSELTVIPPASAVPNNPQAVAAPKTYTGNSAVPKTNPRFK